MRGRTVALLGLTFEPNTDDMRDAPAIAIATTLADAVVIVTEWDAFRALDFHRLAAVMIAPVLVDLRNVYRRQAV